MAEGRQDSRISAGGSVDGTDLPAFTLDWPADPPIPVLLAVPHAGRAYPDELVGQMRRPEYSQLRLEDRHVDRLGREIAVATGAPLLVAHAPRAMLDLNRAPEDMDWSMVEGQSPAISRNSLANRRSRGGLGLVPRRLAGLGEIWQRPMARAELDRRIAHIHRPYHAELSRSLEALRDRWGAALLVDLHSMPPLKQRHGAQVPAEYVVGDRFGSSCDGMLSARALRYFAQAERPAAHNRPYAGGYVLDRHGSPARGIHAMQLEICRASYLDARLEEPSARAGAVVKIVAGLVRDLAGEVAALGRDRMQPLAAE